MSWRPRPAPTKAPKRRARGIGGKGGKTAGRGTKGQRSRGRGKVPRVRGRRMPLRSSVSRSSRGSTTRSASSTPRSTSTPSRSWPIASPSAGHARVARRRRLPRKGAYVKVLGRGELTRKLDVHVHAVSKTAESAITAVGGTVTLVPLPFKGENKAGRPAAKGTSSPTDRFRSPRRPARFAVETQGSTTLLSSLKNIFKIPDLRNKILFTVVMIVFYRFGTTIRGSGIDHQAIKQLQDAASTQGAIGFLNLFSGGAFRASRSSPSGSCRTSRRASSCRSSAW